MTNLPVMNDEDQQRTGMLVVEDWIQANSQVPNKDEGTRNGRVSGTQEEELRRRQIRDKSWEE